MPLSSCPDNCFSVRVKPCVCLAKRQKRTRVQCGREVSSPRPKLAITSCVITSFSCRVTGCQMWTQWGESLLQWGQGTDYKSGASACPELRPALPWPAPQVWRLRPFGKNNHVRRTGLVNGYLPRSTKPDH